MSDTGGIPLEPLEQGPAEDARASSPGVQPGDLIDGYTLVEKPLRETLERRQRVLGPDHIDVLDSRLALNRVLELRSEFDEAEAAELSTRSSRKMRREK